MRKLTDLPSWPEARFEVAWLAPQIGVGDRQARRVLAELDDAGFLEREERIHPRYGQKANFYKCTVPNNSGYVRPRSDVVLRFGVVDPPMTFSTSPYPLTSETEPSESSRGAPAPARAEAEPAVAAAAATSTEHPFPQETGPCDAAPRRRPSTGRSRGPHKAARSTALPADLLGRLAGLPGASEGIHVLERAALPLAEATRVVDRVLEIERNEGVGHLGKLIHGPIRDARARIREAAEKAQEQAGWAPDEVWPDPEPPPPEPEETVIESAPDQQPKPREKPPEPVIESPVDPPPPASQPRARVREMPPPARVAEPAPTPYTPLGGADLAEMARALAQRLRGDTT